MIDFSMDKAKGTPALWLRVLGKIAHLLKLESASNRLLPKRYKSYYSKALYPEIERSDGIIFAGGSFKYGTQDLWARYSAIVDYANKHHIPVMFDAMNVQKYDATDFKCRYLKEHLNRECVRYFTSRDGEPGVKRLELDYAENNTGLKILPAADPAFWIPETYHVKRNKNADTIGINVIAPDRFRVYGGTLQPSDIKAAYLIMLDRLTEHGFSWQLFTNGMQDDNVYAFELSKHYNLTEQGIHIPKSDTELVNMEANYRAIFGARLHSMICAYLLGVPVAGFIWDEKIIHFAEMARLKELFLEESTVTGDAMFEVLMKALQREDDAENRHYWKNTTKNTIYEFLSSIESV